MQYIKLTVVGITAGMVDWRVAAQYFPLEWFGAGLGYFGDRMSVSGGDEEKFQGTLDAHLPGGRTEGYITFLS